MKKNCISIAIAEDQFMFRRAISNYINQLENCKILFEAGNGLEVQEEIKKGKVPEILILDLKMQVMNGFEILNWLQLFNASVRPIILSQYDSDYNIIKAFRSGARAFLKKNMHIDELKSAILSVKEKGYYHTDNITRKLINFLYNEVETDFDFRKYSLNEKESCFLHLVTSDLTYKEIAREMKLSLRAIDKIRDRLFYKFDVKSRVALAVKTLNEGIEA